MLGVAVRSSRCCGTPQPNSAPRGAVFDGGFDGISEY